MVQYSKSLRNPFWNRVLYKFNLFFEKSVVFCFYCSWFIDFVIIIMIIVGKRKIIHRFPILIDWQFCSKSQRKTKLNFVMVIRRLISRVRAPRGGGGGYRGDLLFCLAGWLWAPPPSRWVGSFNKWAIPWPSPSWNLPPGIQLATLQAFSVNSEKKSEDNTKK